MSEVPSRALGDLKRQMSPENNPQLARFIDKDAMIFDQLAALGRIDSTKKSAYFQADSQQRNGQTVDVPGFSFEEYIEIKKKLDKARQTTVMRVPTTKMLSECLKGEGEQQSTIDAVDIEVLNRRWILYQIREEISKWGGGMTSSGQHPTDFAATAFKAEGIISGVIMAKVVPNEIVLTFPATNKSSYEDLASEGGRNAVSSLREKLLAIVGPNQVVNEFKVYETKDTRGVWSLKLEIQFQSQFIDDAIAQLEKRDDYNDLLNAFKQTNLKHDEQMPIPSPEEYVAAWKLVGKYLEINPRLFIKAIKSGQEVIRKVADIYSTIMAPTASGASLMKLLESTPVDKDAVRSRLAQPGISGILARQIRRVLGL